jgi:hypothetical protein
MIGKRTIVIGLLLTASPVIASATDNTVVPLAIPPHMQANHTTSTLQSLLEEARAGDPPAETKLSAFYYNQVGLDGLNQLPTQIAQQDMTRSVYWAAANQGYAPGQEFLGVLDIMGGPGYPLHCQQGIRQLQEAADKGDTLAKHALTNNVLMGRCQLR